MMLKLFAYPSCHGKNHKCRYSIAMFECLYNLPVFQYSHWSSLTLPYTLGRHSTLSPSVIKHIACWKGRRKAIQSTVTTVWCCNCARAWSTFHKACALWFVALVTKASLACPVYYMQARPTGRTAPVVLTWNCLIIITPRVFSASCRLATDISGRRLMSRNYW